MDGGLSVYTQEWTQYPGMNRYPLSASGGELLDGGWWTQYPAVDPIDPLPVVCSQNPESIVKNAQVLVNLTYQQFDHTKKIETC